VATIKGPNGAEIVYPAIGASEFIEPEGYPGKILTGQAIDVKFTLPDGADYGVDIDLGILFNNDGTLPVKARRAAAPEGYDFRVNGEYGPAQAPAVCWLTAQIATLRPLS